MPDGVPRAPACHANAARLLRGWGLPFTQIVRVDRDSILYLTNPDKEPRTVWLHRNPETNALSYKVAVGFAVDPPEWEPTLVSSESSSPTSPDSVSP